MLSHSDNVQATGFVEHLKLPHYVDFQAELGLVRTLRAEHEARVRATRRRDQRGGGGMNARQQPATTSPISTSRPSG